MDQPRCSRRPDCPRESVNRPGGRRHIAPDADLLRGRSPRADEAITVAAGRLAPVRRSPSRAWQACRVRVRRKERRETTRDAAASRPRPSPRSQPTRRRHPARARSVQGACPDSSDQRNREDAKSFHGGHRQRHGTPRAVPQPATLRWATILDNRPPCHPCGASSGQRCLKTIPKASSFGRGAADEGIVGRVSRMTAFPLTAFTPTFPEGRGDYETCPFEIVSQ